MVVRPGDHKFAVRTETDHSYGSGVALIRQNRPTPSDIPQFNVASIRPWRQVIWIIKFIMSERAYLLVQNSLISLNEWNTDFLFTSARCPGSVRVTWPVSRSQILIAPLCSPVTIPLSALLKLSPLPIAFRSKLWAEVWFGFETSQIRHFLSNPHVASRHLL